MPVFTNPISNQNQATSSGQNTYPQIGQMLKSRIVSDEFLRTTLNPTNSYALYTTAAASSGTTTISNNQQLQITTAATNNDYVSVATTGFAVFRPSWLVDLSRSLVIIDTSFWLGTTTNIQIFCGIINATSPITALPASNQNFLGIQANTAVSANFQIVSCDGGGTIISTDTGIAINNTNNYRVQIQWMGQNSATINFYESNGNTPTGIIWTLKKSYTVTSFFASSNEQACLINWFVKTLTAGVANNYIRGWIVSAQ